MLDRMRKLIDRAGQAEEAEHLDDEELKLATAALLIHTSLIDGELDPAEEKKLFDLLARHFDLPAQEVEDLVARGREKEVQAIDLYGFTRVIRANLDQGGRRRIVELLWEMVFADGRLDDFESNLVWRVSELVGVSTRERVELRQTVSARYED